MDLRRQRHKTRGTALGLLVLSRDDLQAAPLDGLARLALFLGVAPMGPHISDGAHRHALIQAVMAEEKRRAKAPRPR